MHPCALSDDLNTYIHDFSLRDTLKTQNSSCFTFHALRNLWILVMPTILFPQKPVLLFGWINYLFLNYNFSSSSSSSSCSWRFRRFSLFLNPQDEVGLSISCSVALCPFFLSVCIAIFVLVFCLCPSSVRVVATVFWSRDMDNYVTIYSGVPANQQASSGVAIVFTKDWKHKIRIKISIKFAL
jgi:hypothetical protein